MYRVKKPILIALCSIAFCIASAVMFVRLYSYPWAVRVDFHGKAHEMFKLEVYEIVLASLMAGVVSSLLTGGLYGLYCFYHSSERTE